MKRKCMECGKEEFIEGTDPKDISISHGYCLPCGKIKMKEIEEWKNARKNSQ